MIVESHQKYRLGFAQPLPPDARDQLIGHLGQPALASDDPLLGRAQADFVTLPSWGKIVVKHYMRGGLMRYISRRRHLRRRTCRGEQEFRMLQSLRETGIPVPEPLGWAERGLIFVETWLFLAEIPHSKTLAQLDQTSPARAQELMPKVGELIDSLTQGHLHHVDLHPGNVLIDDQNNVHLIDFDKAVRATCSLAELSDRYYRRWNRAIAKHKLSPELKLPAPATDTPAQSDTITQSN